MALKGKPKDKISRRDGRNLYLKGARDFTKPGVVRRPTKPGQHGKTKRRLTTYGLQLREKQAVKFMYLLGEKRFRRIFDMALDIANKTGAPKGTTFLQLLERMLFIVLYRAGLAKSKGAARQLVVHGHVYVNGRRVKSPTYFVKEGDKIEVSLKVFEKYKPDYAHPGPAAWLDVKDNVCIVKRYPTREEIRQDIDESLVIAWYTR